jgi:hypothetical protein
MDRSARQPASWLARCFAGNPENITVLQYLPDKNSLIFPERAILSGVE